MNLKLDLKTLKTYGKMRGFQQNEAHIGYDLSKLLNCAVFKIDELEYETPPDIIR